MENDDSLFIGKWISPSFSGKLLNIDFNLKKIQLFIKINALSSRNTALLQ